MMAIEKRVWNILVRATEGLRKKPPSKELLAAEQAYITLSEPEKKQFQLNNKLQDKSTSPPGRDPSQDMINLAWKWIIRTFVGVFFAAAGIIFAVIVQFLKPVTPNINIDPLIAIFSTTVGYLAGVLTPKPGSS